MWNMGVGWIELAIFLSIAAAAVLSRGAARRWLGVVLAITGFGIVLTPSDPASALLVAAPLSIAFALGVYAAPFLRQFDAAAGQ